MSDVTDPVKAFNDYVAGVSSGKILAAKPLRDAVARHVADMKRKVTAKRWPWVFEPDRLTRVFRFCRLCVHGKGEKAGQPFIPEPWQCFVFGSVFGWVHKETKIRRFRHIYQEVPRKNGKTLMLAVVGLYAMVADGEEGAEIFSAATKREQAREIFDVAKNMAQKSPALKKRIVSNKLNLSMPGTMAKFEPLGRDHNTMDGSNPHCYLIDEYHAHRDDGIPQVLDSGTGARTQPIGWTITTAGFNLYGPCKKLHDVCRAILDPDKPESDDRLFIFIATIDDGDDPHSPKTWAKANPNYGVSVTPEGMKQASTKAKNMTSELNNFLTKRLNVWVGQQTAWLKMDRWNDCAAEQKIPNGRQVFVGLDLSSRVDLTALVAIAHDDEDDCWDVWAHFWAPKEGARERSKVDRVPYLAWEEEGLLTLTEGDMIDYDFIKSDIAAIADRLGFKEIAVDPWGATQLTTQLEGDGFQIVGVRQGFGSLSSPSKELEALTLARRMRHGGHPILSWCAGNCAVETDPAGNIKPSKRNSNERIDGIVALVMALARGIVATEEKQSVYEKRGVRTL